MFQKFFHTSHYCTKVHTVVSIFVLVGCDSCSLSILSPCPNHDAGALLGAGYGLSHFNIDYTFVNDFEDHYRPLLAAVEMQGVQWTWKV